ncbi:Pfam:DUF23 [Seminavis robusta]|uniref:Pfam:DUF23 n=1 Tax=Seminavis robusta TaxID=568900 RepID=A0A9N8DVK8_9STRA|nr:Pfam:DUF23 [Seminavis robusta]|eukprot:Sro308_g113560.1 Pfam:DUF23 (909) ;mRNA; f:34382-37197
MAGRLRTRGNRKKTLWTSKPFLLLSALILGSIIFYGVLVVRVAFKNPDLIISGQEQEEDRYSSSKSSKDKFRRFLEFSKQNQDASSSSSQHRIVSKPQHEPNKEEPSDHVEQEERHKRQDQQEEKDETVSRKKGPRGQQQQQQSPASHKSEDTNKRRNSRNHDPSSKSNNKAVPPKPKVNKSLPVRQVMRPMWMPKPKGQGVRPQVLLQAKDEQDTADANAIADQEEQPFMLKAFVEPIDFDEWEQKPLPSPRKTATADQLYELHFPKVAGNCQHVPKYIPADEYPDQDTFLPWIHDVFPTHDGKYIQFIAQNRRRCHTGNTPEEIELLHVTQPNIALFQHVPVKRVFFNKDETRYQLVPHEQADPDGVATRFICRFKPSMEETLSVYNFDYDYASYRKRPFGGHTFNYEDGGIKSVHLTQFLFRCPVPEHLVETVRTGASIDPDTHQASLFVDVIPIRTPPRYGLSNEFLQPKYADSDNNHHTEGRFDPTLEWGEHHILPRIEDSGRWENFPICRPSLQEYYSPTRAAAAQPPPPKEMERNDQVAPRMHRLVSCMWASAGYTTRGERFAINDGQRRMLEWIHYNKLLGFEHFYLYDNSDAYNLGPGFNLKPIADLFPDEITYITWPFSVCNNNPNNVDSPGERSSQYAAESSCRLRFGPHVEWIGQFDMDEYLIPMGSYTSVLPILDSLDEKGTKILSFGSWRAWPRRDLIEEPVPITDRSQCDHHFHCFELQVPTQRTYLQTYNCDRQSGPKKDVMPAEKQLYKPSYVRQHFIHYSSVTILSDMNKTEFEKQGYDWFRTRIAPDPKSRFSDEVNEATMLHTKAIARQDTAGWNEICKVEKYGKGATCRIGVPYPEVYDEERDGPGNKDGFAYNCYINKKTETHWVPRLEKAIAKEHGHIFDSTANQ